MAWLQRAAALMLSVIAIVGVTTLASSGVRAQAAEDQAAHTLFEAGRTAYSDERYEDALRLFQQSYDLSHRAALLYNIGSAADRAGHLERARDAYRQYLQGSPDPSVSAVVARRVSELDRLAVTAAPQPTETSVPAAALADAPSVATHSITDETWFWVLVAVGGAVVIGGAIGIGVAASGPSHQALEPGNVGGVVFALDGP